MQHGIDDVKAWSVIKIISCDNNFLFSLFFSFCLHIPNGVE